MPKLIGIASAFPSQLLTQDVAKDFAQKAFSDLFTNENKEKLLGIFDHSEVKKRYITIPLQWFEQRRTFFEANEKYIKAATDLGTQAVLNLLEKLNLSPEDIDHLVFVSTTGISTPSIDAHIANRIPFRIDLKRTPLWGLGCLGGVGGLAHAYDFALGNPKHRVLLLNVELCSLTFQIDDQTKKNIVACSLFGDGATACLITGNEVKPSTHKFPHLEIVASANRFWPNSLGLMGWDIRDPGLYVILSPELPGFVGEQIGPDFGEFLKKPNVDIHQINQFAAHPGGIKVLNALSRSLKLTEAPFKHSLDVLREYGNMSAATCLVALERIMERDPPGIGGYTAVMAMGPGFSSGYVLLARPK